MELLLSEKNRRPATISRVARRKLIQMNRARVLQNLAVPPGQPARSTSRRLAGFHSIRINEIVPGKRSITPPVSIRFCAFFGQSEDWLRQKKQPAPHASPVDWQSFWAGSLAVFRVCAVSGGLAGFCEGDIGGGCVVRFPGN